jgi:hypothetical protein
VVRSKDSNAFDVNDGYVLGYLENFSAGRPIAEGVKGPNQDQSRDFFTLEGPTSERPSSVPRPRPNNLEALKTELTATGTYTRTAWAEAVALLRVELWNPDTDRVRAFVLARDAEQIARMPQLAARDEGMVKELLSVVEPAAHALRFGLPVLPTARLRQMASELAEHGSWPAGWEEAVAELQA